MASWTLLASVASAADLPIAPYAIETWTTANGLPQNSVTAMAQTVDGYLWMGTFSGLVRFDGAQFTVFDQENVPPLRSSQIRDLYADRQGRLWIMDLAGGISRLEQGRFTREAISQGMHDCWEDGAGTVWFSSITGDSELLRWNGTALVSAPLPPGCPTTPPLRLWHERDDLFWAMTGSEFGPITSNVFTPLCHGEFYSPGSGPRYLRPNTSLVWPFRGAEHGVWLKGTNGLQRIHQDRRPGETITFPEPVKHTDSKFLEERNGTIWVLSSTRELWRYDTNGHWTTLTSAQGLYKSLRCIFEDREHSIWIGTDGGGVQRLRPQVFRTVDERHGLSAGTSYCATEDAQGKVWVGAYAGGLKQSDGDRFADFETEGAGFETAQALFATPEGVWAAFASGIVMKIRDGRVVTQVRAGKNVYALRQDHQGVLWISHAGGVDRFCDGTLRSFGKSDGITRRVCSIEEDSRHQLWFGSEGEGLYRLDGSKFTNFRDSADNANNSVRSLLIDRGDTIWIGTASGGLARFKNGKFARFGMKNGFPDKVVNCILDDGLGYLWTSGARGIVRVSRSDLENFFAGRPTRVQCDVFGERDGLENRESRGLFQPHGFKAHDGKLWFCTLKGVSVVDPTSIHRSKAPPLMAIQEILIDGSSPSTPRLAETVNTPDSAVNPVAKEAAQLAMSLAPPQKIIVPPGRHRLDITYVGLGFVQPERNRYKYRLKGVDADWVDAGHRTTASYSPISPGSYEFEVSGCNRDGLWSDASAALAIAVQPFFWQTGWFMGFVALCAGATIFGIYQLRVTQLQRARLLQEAFSRRLIESQEGERKRIAAELHDSLGQSLLVVKNYASRALHVSETPEKVREQLREISENTSTSIEEVRSIARALRPYQLDRFGLTKTLEDAADLVAKSGNLQITAEVDAVDGLFTPDAEIGIYRVAQEWLNNVVKHAQASSARLQVRKHPALVRIVMEDDGIGFDYAAVMNRSGSTGSFGLVNLRERVRLLGGVLKIETAPGKGTRLSVDIPL